MKVHRKDATWRRTPIVYDITSSRTMYGRVLMLTQIFVSFIVI